MSQAGAQATKSHQKCDSKAIFVPIFPFYYGRTVFSLYAKNIHSLLLFQLTYRCEQQQRALIHLGSLILHFVLCAYMLRWEISIIPIQGAVRRRRYHRSPKSLSPEEDHGSPLPWLCFYLIQSGAAQAAGIFPFLSADLRKSWQSCLQDLVPA